MGQFQNMIYSFHIASVSQTSFLGIGGQWFGCWGIIMSRELELKGWGWNFITQMYPINVQYRGGELKYYIHTYRHTYRPSDEEGSRGAFAPRMMGDTI